MHIHVTRASSENGWYGRRADREGRGNGKNENKRRTASIIEIGRGGVPRMKPRPGLVISILNASPRIARTRVDARMG